MSATSLARLCWSLLCLLLANAAGAAGTLESTYMGEARDKGGALIYTEHHVVSSSDGRTTRSLTQYRAGDGRLIATLSSDYSRSVAMPTYVFEDLRRNYREGLRWEAGEHIIFKQEGDAPEKRARLEDDTRVFSCQGWHYYLVNNLDLLEKERITLNLVLPSDLRAYPFVVKKLHSDEAQVSAELSLRNRFLRHFAPKLFLKYDREKKRLLEFQGVSNILSAEGDRQEVTIRYFYDGR
jgi:hypothetical protein